MRFLISRLSALGDVVCTLPVASCLRQAFPDSHITWVVDPRFAGIVECCTAVDEVVRAKPGFKSSTWPTFEAPFDAALDMQGLTKSGIVVGRAKSPIKLAYHWQRELSRFFAGPVLPDPTSIHIVDQYVDVARATIEALSSPSPRRGSSSRGGGRGVGNDLPTNFALEPKPEDLESVKSALAERGVTGRFVAMNAGAGWATKRWPATSFARVADALAEQGIASVFLGGKAQADHDAYNEVVASAKNPPVSLVGATSVRELVALLSMAKGHVGGDTGSTHLTAALGKPAIGLYSITKPQRSCPYGQMSNTLYDPSGLAAIPADAVLALLASIVATG
jgi:ADP-heptose:LPS heptosyltransferase